MASGEVHQDYLNKAWAIIIPLGVILFLLCLIWEIENSYLYPIFFFINYWLCDFIDPDDDLMGLTGSEGRILRLSKKYWLGFIGAIFVSYGFIYAYIIGLFGGHRSWLSHGWVIGTIGRMIFYNIPLFAFLYWLYLYAVRNWDANPIAPYDLIFFWDYTKIYLLTQFLAWNIGDGIHLILDTNFAKGTLYQPKKENRQQ